MLSTVAVMSLTTSRAAAGGGGFDGFDGGGDDVVGGVTAGRPGANEFAAGVFGLDADLLEARVAKQRSKFVNAGSASDTAAESGEVRGDFGWQFGGPNDIRDGNAPTGFENAKGFAKHLWL